MPLFDGISNVYFYLFITKKNNSGHTNLTAKHLNNNVYKNRNISIVELNSIYIQILQHGTEAIKFANNENITILFFIYKLILNET